MSYQVFVDDNFHYMDESERYQLGDFDSLDAAVAACKRIVDEFLLSNHRPGMTSDALMAQYTLYGEDPFVCPGDGTVPFSARDYASERVRAISPPFPLSPPPLPFQESALRLKLCGRPSGPLPTPRARRATLCCESFSTP